MKVHQITRDEFHRFVFENTDEFMSWLDKPECFIVKGYYDKELILELRRRAFESGLQAKPSWHPLLDDCPDYHRLHDNYAKAHVKAKMHAFYYHGWFEQNAEIFEAFTDIFAIKNMLGGHPGGSFRSAKPSDGIVSRICVHNYPRGGGYQAEHIDPVTPFAKLQTIVQASQPGQDYERGGLYCRTEPGGDKFYVDPYTEPGDLMLLSPGIPHGVEEVDPTADYEWTNNDGRWMFMPIILYSDYAGMTVERPRQLDRT